MMKKKIRSLVLWLMVVSILPVSLFACKGKKNPPDPGTTDGVAEPSTYDVNGGGRDFIVLSREVVGDYLFAYDEVDVTLSEDGTQDRVGSAVFARDQHVNDMLGINLVGSKKTQAKMKSEIEKCHMSGLQTYDVVMPMVQDAFWMAINGYLYEWGRIPYVDLTKDYWMGDFFDMTSIGGYHFYCPGTANISAYNTVGVTFFNKQLRINHSLENPYDLVKEGTWTIEAMQEMCRVVTTDTDGYPGMTYKDTYGLAVNSFVWQPFFHSSGYAMVEKNENGVPYLSATSGGMSEIVNNILSVITSMVNDTSMAILTNREEYSGAVFEAANLETDIFLGDRALFWVENIYGQYSLRNMKTDYGILPMPKWNTAAEYTSYSHAGHASVMSVPLTAPEVRLSGAVLEEMTAYSDKVLIPEFYEQTIRVRGTRDEESYEMLDIIYQKIVIDLGMVMTASGLGLDTAIRGMLNFNDTGFSTMFKSQGTGYQKIIDNLALSFANHAADQYRETD